MVVEAEEANIIARHDVAFRAHERNQASRFPANAKSTTTNHMSLTIESPDLTTANAHQPEREAQILVGKKSGRGLRSVFECYGLYVPERDM